MKDTLNSLEDKLHNNLSKFGEMGFYLIPGAFLLDARHDDKTARVSKHSKVLMYSIASCLEIMKIGSYSFALYILSKRFFN